MSSQPHSGFTRVPYVQRCSLAWEEEAHQGLVCNISLLGVYVAVEPQPDVGQAVWLAFPIPWGILEVEGVVTWQNPDPPERVDAPPQGCGLRFVSLLPDDRGRIEKLVRDYVDRVEKKLRSDLRFPDVVQVPCFQTCYVVRADGATLRGHLCHVSLHGVYAAVEPIPEMGEEVQLSFTLLADSTPIVDRAVVTWQNFGPPQRVDSLPQGCGLRFRSLDSSDRDRIEAAVREYVQMLTSRTPAGPPAGRGGA
jgi:Tfp pilus assembly protein PilZ